MAGQEETQGAVKDPDFFLPAYELIILVALLYFAGGWGRGRL